MVVYCVLGHTDYEGDCLLLVTCDEKKAQAEAYSHSLRGWGFVFVQKWADDKYDAKYECGWGSSWYGRECPIPS